MVPPRVHARADIPLSERIRAHSWIKDVPVHGLIYEVETGALREVV